MAGKKRDATSENARTLQKMRENGQRLQSLDAIRGLSIILMVGYHFLFDLVEFAGAPRWWFSNPLFDFLQVVFSAAFILMAGISSHLSRNNWKRGGMVCAAALVITAATYTLDKLLHLQTLVTFGVLHLLGVCILIYAAARKVIDRIPRWAAPVLYLALLYVTRRFCYMRYVETPFLFPFGMVKLGFYWGDYYPLFPWMFVFFLGTWLGQYLVEGKFPKMFYKARCPLLAWFGQHTLAIYLIQQPVLYVLTMLLAPIVPVLLGG